MAEQRLWAPWRMKYVQAERKDEGCISCLAAQAGDDESRLVLHRGERCFAMLNAVGCVPRDLLNGRERPGSRRGVLPRTR